ncbi:uncharacterized protein LOC143214391 [Lasioglossum baleicum]|uniref:uncharacterized protein LOC143214391 n=1 Tax=Lasioglossum baleicum TaxID=434251 RepID=UPI003FCCF1FA
MIVTLSIFYSLLIAVESSKCPEPRKPHPTSCTVFYNCVNLPDGGYVWVPRKCTDGLVFQPYLRMCILPGDSWTCDLSTESVVTNRYDTPELINPNETSYMGSTEDPSNFSELIDSSYVTEDVDNSNHEMVTPYPLIKIEETLGNQPQKMINNLPNSFKKEYLMLNRLIQHLSIHKEITIPLELLASLSMPSKATSKAPTKPEFSKASQQSVLMSYFVQNRIQQTNLENIITASAKSQDPVKYPAKNEEKSMSDTQSLNDTLEGLLNDPENENKLILISSNTGNRQFFTVETYKSLGYRVDPKFIQVIPCVANVRTPNATDCVKYYICKPEIVSIIEHSCPPFTAFNKYSRVCDRESYSKCKENTPEKIEDSENKLEIKAPGKVCTEHGKTKDVTSDSHYYVCYSASNNGDDLKSTRMSCPNSLIFCQSKKVCTTRRLCKGT